MRRRWTCARWRPAAWSSPLLLLVLAGCGGGGGGAQKQTTTVAARQDPLPVLRAADACPVSAPHATAPRFGDGLGDGPAYPVAGFFRAGTLELAPPANFGSERWAGQKVLWVVAPGAPADLVVRGARLDRPGQVRFDDGDVPAGRLELPRSEPSAWVDRPGYTRVQQGGCYAYVVEGPGLREVVVFRAVATKHRDRTGDVVRGRSAAELERAIVRPGGVGENGLAAPYEAGCSAATAAERRGNGFGGSPWEFVCSIADEIGTRRYDVQILPNWCYVAALRRRLGEHTRGIQACRDVR